MTTLVTPAVPARAMRSMRIGDVARGSAGTLRARPGRTALTALGIAIGIAALVAVVGVSSSSRAGVLAQLDRLGTNLLRVRPGQSVFGEASTLPDEAPGMIRRIGPVTAVSSTAAIGGATVRRTDRISVAETGGIVVTAVDRDFPTTVGASVSTGRFLDPATERLPAVVLGATAARRLGIGPELRGSPMVWIGERWWAVVGILDPVGLVPELDSGAFIGFPAAADLLDHDGKVSGVFVRTANDAVSAVRGVLARTANPQDPNEVDVSRPSDALAARAAIDRGLRALLLGLGAVSLLVGGIGIANVMVISVLERRAEIGVRRALGATRRHIGQQFLFEAGVLALLGGCGGVVIGSAVTWLYAQREGTPVAIPPAALGIGLGAAIVVGLLAGSFPAGRAARLDPATALRPA